MWQCPVCKSEAGGDPVCPVCGFDITCDYERFPTLSAGIPRDLKARALERVKAVEGDVKKAEAPTGAPEHADEPPVSLLSQKEIDDRLSNMRVFASALAFGSFFATFFVYVGLIYNKMNLSALLSTLLSRLDTERPGETVLFLILLYLLCFILLKRSVEKMRPDEWAWKRQSDGKWTVLKKDASGSGQEKKMLTALLLFYFGWVLGLDMLYLDGLSKGKWRLVKRCLISCGGIALFLRIMDTANTSENISNWTIIAMTAIFWVWLIFAYIAPLVRILRLPPEFEKGEY